MIQSMRKGPCFKRGDLYDLREEFFFYFFAELGGYFLRKHRFFNEFVENAALGEEKGFVCQSRIEGKDFVLVFLVYFLTGFARFRTERFVTPLDLGHDSGFRKEADGFEFGHVFYDAFANDVAGTGFDVVLGGLALLGFPEGVEEVRELFENVVARGFVARPENRFSRFETVDLTGDFTKERFERSFRDFIIGVEFLEPKFFQTEGVPRNRHVQERAEPFRIFGEDFLEKRFGFFEFAFVLRAKQARFFLGNPAFALHPVEFRTHVEKDAQPALEIFYAFAFPKAHEVEFFHQGENRRRLYEGRKHDASDGQREHEIPDSHR